MDRGRLGLSIGQGIVSAYGGRIDVESTPGVGTTFRVLLPAAAAMAMAAPMTAMPRATPAPVRATPLATEPGGRILIVDDEAAVAAALRRMLGRRHEIHTTTSASEALERLGRERFAIIFCDLMMPTMTGMDLFESLLARNDAIAGRFVFMTGGAFTPRAREFLERVPNPRLEKPFDPTRLRTIVGQLLSPPA